ncbi:MAG: tyrosine recombinase XerC [Ruminococcaceae bacterium]|nr:tyrosine recombinase XerC [Oscillospiraceae bacterium]
MNIPNNTPAILSNFLIYLGAVRGLSSATIQEYYLDLRTFFRFLLIHRGLADVDAAFEEISIQDVGIELIRGVTLSDLYDFLIFLRENRPKYHKSATTPYGDEAGTRARKIAALRAFFKYLHGREHLIEDNPAAELEIPKAKKQLPKYLSLEESVQLLSSVDGPYRERDYCILTIFLNCGLRVSELAGLNLGDVSDTVMRVTGKGNKQRMIPLNDAVREAIRAYLPHRIEPASARDQNALFTSRNRNRISVQTVKLVVNRHLERAGLSYKDCSAHKLRHTAATLMYQNGVDIRTLQEFLGHEQVNTTMIYTHIENVAIREAVDANPLGKVHSDSAGAETPVRRDETQEETEET